MDIKTTLTNDQIATEVRGRQLMIENLDKFLSDSSVLRSKSTRQAISYK